MRQSKMENSTRTDKPELKKKMLQLMKTTF